MKIKWSRAFLSIRGELEIRNYRTKKGENTDEKISGGTFLLSVEKLNEVTEIREWLVQPNFMIFQNFKTIWLIVENTLSEIKLSWIASKE